FPLNVLATDHTSFLLMFRAVLRFHLRFIDLLVDGIGFQKFLMCPHRMDPAVIQDNNLVSLHYGSNPLDDNDFRHMSQCGKRAAYPGLCGGVHSAGGIVEDEYLRVPEKGSGNAEPLFLSAGYVHAALAKIGIQAFWH